MASYNDDFSNVKRDMKKTYEKGDKVPESQGWWAWALEKISSAKEVLIKLFIGDEKDKREGMKDDGDDGKQDSEKMSEEEDLDVGFDHEEKMKLMDEKMIPHEEKIKLIDETMMPHDHESEWTMIHEIVSEGFCKERLEIFLSVRRNDFFIEHLLQHILENNNKEAVYILMSYISKQWKEDFGDKTITVWLGSDYREGKTGEKVLVCFHTADTLSERSNFLNLPVIYKNYDATEKEPLENRLLDDYQRVSFDANDAATIKAWITKHGEILFKSHSNLEVISASSVKSTKRGIIKQTSILLYCRFKGIIPYGETSFPDKLTLNGHDYYTDVREGYFFLGMMPAQRQQQNPHPHWFNERLRMGCSIGILGSNFAGTLGPFVRLDTNDIGFLTCAHVVRIGNSMSVVQPSDIEHGYQNNDRTCGTVMQDIFDGNGNIGIDIALVKIDKARRGVDLGSFVWMDSLQLLTAGFGQDDFPSFVNGTVIRQPSYEELNGKRLIKFGRTSGLTRGEFAFDGAMLRTHHVTYPCNTVLRGQFLIKNIGTDAFAAKGDSGAGVYVLDYPSKGKLALVGIVIGAITQGECVMTPIGPVLDALFLNENNIVT